MTSISAEDRCAQDAPVALVAVAPSMLTSFYGAVTRLFAPLSWRFERRAARLLRDFAHAERGSVIDMQQAANLTESPERAADYIRHALDEWRHAELFALHATRFDERRVPIIVDTEHLFAHLGEERFLAFVHMGEGRGRAQFHAHRAYLKSQSAPGAKRMNAALAQVIKDEDQHFSYTGAHLHALTGASKAGPLVRAMRRRQLWRSWRRMGRGMAEHVYALLSSVLYVCAAPLYFGARARAKYQGHWVKAPPGQTADDARYASDAAGAQNAPRGA